jgi:hypothetical protein
VAPRGVEGKELRLNIGIMPTGDQVDRLSERGYIFRANVNAELPLPGAVYEFAEWKHGPNKV